MAAESSDAMVLTLRLPSITMSPVPLTARVRVPFVVGAVMEDTVIAVMLESPPNTLLYNSSKLSLTLDIALRRVSPVPVFMPEPMLIFLRAIGYSTIYLTEKEVPHPQLELALGLS